MIARRLLVRGRVQGVFYRSWTVETARALGLFGWVRNLRSGDVEILAIGNALAIDKLAEACADGPAAAQVEHVGIEDAQAEQLGSFEKRPTV